MTHDLKRWSEDAPEGYRAAKRAHAEIGPEIVDETARRIAGIRATPEAQEGLSAFLERRKPSWVTREARSQPDGSRHGAKND